MSGAEETAAGFLARLDAVMDRLRQYADLASTAGLTSPDPPTDERWDWGQVWAHLAEFCPYWMGQVRLILDSPEGEDPVPFGRVKSDPGRVAAIEADRLKPPVELMNRLEGHVKELRALLGEMFEGDWVRRGLHQTLGEMTMPKIVDEFLVGHLEAHADQLEGLNAGARGR
jgi:hypothetical protein